MENTEVKVEFKEPQTIFFLFDVVFLVKNLFVTG